MFACLDAALELVQAAWRDNKNEWQNDAPDRRPQVNSSQTSSKKRNLKIYGAISRERGKGGMDGEYAKKRVDEVSRRTGDGYRRPGWSSCLLTVFL